MSNPEDRSGSGGGTTDLQSRLRPPLRAPSPGFGSPLRAPTPGGGVAVPPRAPQPTGGLPASGSPVPAAGTAPQSPPPTSGPFSTQKPTPAVLGPVQGDSVQDFLHATPLMRGCDAALVARVAAQTERLEFAPRELIVRAGGASQGLFLLKSGRASVQLVNAATGATMQLETINAGDHFGDVGALLRAANPHNVVADEPSVVLRFRQELVDALVAREPSVVQALARRLAMRAVQLGMLALRGGTEVSKPPAPASAPPARTEPPGGVIPFGEVAEYEPSPRTVGLLPPKMIAQLRAFPLRLQGTTLTVGMVHPRDLTALGELRRVLEPTQVEPVALSADDFATALVRYRIGARGETTGAELRPESLVFDAADAERESDKAARVVGDEVVRLVNRIVAAALSREASDVHVEPEVTGVRVRFRVHGALQDWNETVAPSFARGVVARFKVLSGLDITERRLPQDGRIGLTAGGRELDLRVSTLPSSRGEKVVLRVFEGAGLLRPLDQLFLEPGTLAGVRRALQRPYGTVLIAGGTGSGKSSTLYALLLERRRARPDTNMLMIEDPIEYRLQGITQVQVNAAAGLGFAQVLRAALRQDPDVLAVGETRDAETAHLALEAGMTGHLLLTLLHANHVGGVLQRLESLGCSRTLVGESASFILAQRLVRKLCPLCMKMEPSAPAMVESLVARRLLEKGANVPLPRAAGCEACHHAGFNGRVAITEALAVTDEVRDAIVGGQAAVEVERIAHAQGAFVSFGQCAAQLLARRIIGPGEALLAAAD